MGKLGAILYGVVGLVAFLFVLVGTPIDQFRSKNVDIIGNTHCLTLWGNKAKCYSTKYDTSISETFPGCNTLVKHFKAAEAFAIISVFVLLVAAIAGLVTCCCCGCLRWVASLLSVVGIVTVVIVWALMAHAYNNNVSGCMSTPFKHRYKYGAGFALIVTGWCLLFVALVVLNLF
ncbi:amastin [Trypanosoma grayi]|uniref:amastin n=1 Tax=Trypanosoma grayi TaxID=71804 RepID=UPI0004F4A615|nr:amastin [Trypanosoma grayi]KEG14368.1 amastin [Trypanosoma grayi]